MKKNVDVFVKCLKLVLVYNCFFIRANHKLQETKVLELVHSKAVTIKP